MFRIVDKIGFHITFDNGWTVSVQFGPGNCCDNRDMKIGKEEEKAGKEGSHTVECMVCDETGKMIQYGDWNDIVGKYMTSAQVLELLNWASKQKSDNS